MWRNGGFVREAVAGNEKKVLEMGSFRALGLAMMTVSHLGASGGLDSVGMGWATQFTLRTWIEFRVRRLSYWCVLESFERCEIHVKDECRKCRLASQAVARQKGDCANAFCFRGGWSGRLVFDAVLDWTTRIDAGCDW